MTGKPDDPEGTPTGRMWLMDLRQAPPLVAARLPAAMRRVELGDAAALAAAMEVDPSAVTARLHSSRRAYAAWVEEQMAAYGWVSFEDEEIGELNLRFRVGPGEVYLWDFATRPAFQRQGLYSALLSHAVRELHAEGLARAWIGADLANAPSQAGIQRAGFTPVADLLIGRGADGRGRRLRGLPGVPARLVADTRWALLGER